MMFIFDTSSFVSIARYYLPFDLKDRIFNHVKTSIVNGRIVLIDAVLEECRYYQKIIVALMETDRVMGEVDGVFELNTNEE